MMAVIGFLVIVTVAIMLITMGLLLTWGSTQIGDRATLAPLLLSVVGSAMLYWACKAGPFTLLVAP